MARDLLTPSPTGSRRSTILHETDLLPQYRANPQTRAGINVT